MNNNPEINGEYKFQNCKHRSVELQKNLIKRCPCQGGDYEDTGYFCEARKIFKIDSSVCEYCYMFENK
jgi:hypothetical protein